MSTKRWKTDGRFLNNLKSVKLGASEYDLVLEPLTYCMGGGFEYTVAPYLVTNGTSRPWYVDWLVSKEKTERMGVLHDDARCRLQTSNFLTDGLLFDSALAETGSIITSLAAWAGVRIGTHTGFTSAPPPEVIDLALWEVSNREEVNRDWLVWDPELSRIILPKSKSL